MCVCGEHKWLAIPQGQAGKSDMEGHVARSGWCQMAKGGSAKETTKAGLWEWQKATFSKTDNSLCSTSKTDIFGSLILKSLFFFFFFTLQNDKVKYLE